MTSILVVNDIPGTGQVAGLTNLAVVTAAGYEATLLPTVYLTHHTGRWPVYRESLDAAFAASLTAWKGTAFRAILTGYFGNAQQIRQFVSWYQTYQAETFLVVDPIMGDRGRLYTGLDADYVAAMQDLVAMADIALPNVTEAYFLAGLDPSQVADQSDDLALAPLRAVWCPNWVITGVEEGDQIGVAPGPDDYIGTTRQPRHFFGTGDFFSSCFLVGALTDWDRQTVCRWCVDLVGQAATQTAQDFPASRQELYYQSALPVLSRHLRQYATKRKEVSL